MRLQALALLGVAAFSLEGCATPISTLSPTGPVNTTATAGPAGTFIAAEKAAQGAPTDETTGLQMFVDGAALIQANCHDYFKTAGAYQTTLIRTRDAVGALSAVTGTVMVLARSDRRQLAGLAVGTTALYTGIDYVTKDFLFNAENIDAVGQLTINALAAHAQKVESSGQKFTYAFASSQLFDEQDICTDRAIAALVKDAIANGHLKASANSVDDDQTTLAAQRDAVVLEALGDDVKASGPLTASEAGALWWLLRERPTADELTTIGKQLVALPAADTPLTPDPLPANKGKFVRVTPWPDEAKVSRDLDRLSDATKAGFKTQIAAARANAQKLVGPLAAPPAAAPFTFTLGGSTATGNAVHYSVKAH